MCLLLDDLLYAQEDNKKVEKKKTDRNENESDIEAYNRKDVKEDWSCAQIVNKIAAAANVTTA